MEERGNHVDYILGCSDKTSGKPPILAEMFANMVNSKVKLCSGIDGRKIGLSSGFFLLILFIGPFYIPIPPENTF